MGNIKELQHEFTLIHSEYLKLEEQCIIQFENKSLYKEFFNINLIVWEKFHNIRIRMLEEFGFILHEEFAKTKTYYDYWDGSGEYFINGDNKLIVVDFKRHPLYDKDDFILVSEMNGKNYVGSICYPVHILQKIKEEQNDT